MKKLRSTTIVPGSLYVKREADRQLHGVLQDMGRPGYVLVARQMGKTNLLLTAKRLLEGGGDAFIYNDLSNVPSSPRDCFRSIIDTALDTHSEKFSGIAKDLANRRSTMEPPPPHIEHDRELRLLLSAIPGKLVVILDEVDALTNASFSDQIFAQIRSTYFSRANYAEFDRLTYILSGVAEPSELIKNKKLSPFNIGEKIFLNDFSYVEVEAFVRQANLSFSISVIKRIFHWTNGNPRMTWDVCAALEDLGGQMEPTPRDVDVTVERLYLRGFDRAPVDHIRTLAEGDRAIRSAITQIRYGHGSTLSDDVKNKLYLAGIVGAESGGPGSVIKNLVIDKALSDEWLRGVERRKAGIISAMSDALNEGLRDEVIRLGEFALEDGAPDDEYLIREFMSRAFFEQDNFLRAIEIIDGWPYSRHQAPSIYFLQQYRIGISLLQLNRPSESIRHLREVIDGGEMQENYLPALTNLAVALVRHDLAANKDDVIATNEKVIELVEKGTTPTPATRKLALVARYNLADIYRELGKHEASIDQLKMAIAHAEGATKALLEYRLARRGGLHARREAIRRACLLLSESKIDKFAPPKSDTPLDLTEDSFLAILLMAADLGEFDSFGAALQPFSRLQSPDQDPLACVVTVGRRLLSAGRTAIASQLIRWGLDNSIAGSEKSRFEAARVLCSLDQAPGDDLVHRYLSVMSGPNAPECLDEIDFNALLGRIVQFNEAGEHGRAKEMLDLLANYRQRTKAGLKAEDFVLVDFLQMRFLYSEGRHEESAQFARAVLQLVPKLLSGPPDSRRMVPLESLLVIRTQAEQLARAALPKQRKFGANERVRVQYGDSAPVEQKYKRIESHLLSGICRIIESE